MIIAVQHAKPLSLIKAGFTAPPLKVIFTPCWNAQHWIKKACKRKILCKKVGCNKSALGSRQTVELKVSPITTFVGVINPFLPPISPYSSRSSWCRQLAWTYVWHLRLSVFLSASLFLVCSPTPNTRVTVPVTSVGHGPRKHVATTWYVCTGIWGWALPCFERGTSGGGKRLQYRDTTRARALCRIPSIR